MNCIVVDDDLLSCRVIESFIRKLGLLNLVGIYNDAISARSILHEKKDFIDVIFLDIQMPEMDGFDFLSSLTSPPHIIIISGADHHAVRAFDFDVVDYLLKPITYSRFCRAVDKIGKYNSKKEPKESGEEEIFIKKKTTLEKLKYREIVYIEALENYVTLATARDKYTIHFTMKAIEGHLPSGIFKRVHRSYIVNKMMIQSIKENSVEVAVGVGVKSIPLGKSYRSALLDDINVMPK